MPHLKTPRNASFFVNHSSSCGREIIHFRFRFLLFSSLWFSVAVVQTQDIQETLRANCVSNDIRKEGHRLEAAVYKQIMVLFPMDCAAHCFREFCCRSANFKKIPFNDGKKFKNCELLHAVANEKPENLKRNENYDYLMLGRDEPYNCICSQCKNGGNCDGITKKCSCSPGYNGAQCENVKSCADLYKQGIKEDGVYSIDPDGGGSFNVSCDMSTDGGGWTVFQRRQDGSVDFYRNWTDYKKCFGNMSGEFWLGLENINRLTKDNDMELRVDLEDFEGEKRYAKYETFKVKPRVDEKYKLIVEGYSGDAGDSLTYHNDMKFSTNDKDNDEYQNNNCAKIYESAWWYNRCNSSNLNGRYSQTSQVDHGHGIQWSKWKGYKYSLKRSEMKTRPRAS